MNATGKKLVRVDLMVPEADLEKLKAKAKELGCSCAFLIRRAIAGYIEGKVDVKVDA